RYHRRKDEKQSQNRGPQDDHCHPHEVGLPASCWARACWGECYPVITVVSSKLPGRTWLWLFAEGLDIAAVSLCAWMLYHARQRYTCGVNVAQSNRWIFGPFLDLVFII